MTRHASLTSPPNQPRSNTNHLPISSPDPCHPTHPPILDAACYETSNTPLAVAEAARPIPTHTGPFTFSPSPASPDLLSTGTACSDLHYSATAHLERRSRDSPMATPLPDPVPGAAPRSNASPCASPTAPAPIPTLPTHPQCPQRRLVSP